MWEVRGAKDCKNQQLRHRAAVVGLVMKLFFGGGRVIDDAKSANGTSSIHDKYGAFFKGISSGGGRNWDFTVL